MTKKDALKALTQTASFIEYLGDNDFRAKAYQTAERALDNLSGDWEGLCERGFTGVRGIGTNLAAHLSEFHATGKFPPLEELKNLIPAGVLELFRVRGLGAKKIKTLTDSGIQSLPDLILAAEQNRLATLKGFGAASQKSILENAEFALKASERRTRSQAEGVLAKLEQILAGVATVQPMGSLRRGLETIGDVDVVVLGDKNTILEKLGNPAPDPQYPHLYSFALEGMTVQLCHAEPNFLGAAQLMMTGSKPLLQELRQSTDITLSSKGFFDDERLIPTPTEAEAWRVLGRTMPPPAWREAEHLGRDVPAQLEMRQMQGMLHVHSTYSDGSHTLREMAAAAQKLGFAYLGICDHSRSAFYAGGLSIQKVQQQWAEIEALNAENLGIVILKGIESDILPDGGLDYPDEILAGFDFVVSSIHSQFTLSSAAQTERLVAAVQNRFTTILGHPTGRLLLRRPSYEFDTPAVLEAARLAGTVVEINANPNRLDLDWRIVLEHPENLYAVNTDAHSTAGYLDLPHGLAAAQLGGVTPERCVNTWDVSRFMQYARQKRS
jgi:DNA polymerase (family X)